MGHDKKKGQSGEPPRKRDRATAVIGGRTDKKVRAARPVGSDRVILPEVANPVSLVSLPGEPEYAPRTSDIQGRYILGDELGQGGMGRVLAARDKDLGRIVALKVLRDEHGTDENLISALMFEARISGQLEHPHIVPVHEIGTLSDGSVFYTMKLTGKMSLRDVLEKMRDQDPGTLKLYSLTRLLGLLRGICMAAEYAHARGVIHRDLKPDNVLIGDYGEVQIMDWGVARVLPKRPGEPALFGGAPEPEGLVVGTPHYMSPEQARGDNEQVGPASDIYSIGIILYQMLTRTLPFDTQSTKEQMEAVVTEPVPPPSRRAPQFEIPDELERICLRAIEYEPDARYGSARELWDEIEAFIEGRKEEERLRKLADAQVAIADEAATRYYLLRNEMTGLVSDVRDAEFGMGYFDPLPERQKAWDHHLRMDYHRLLVARAFAEAVAGYQQALAHQPSHAHARLSLASLHRAQSKDAGLRGDPEAMILYGDLERALWATDSGDEQAVLHVRSYPVGATIRLFELTGAQTLKPEAAIELGVAPCADLEVAPGAYLVSAVLAGCREKRVPVVLRAGQVHNLLVTLRPWSGDLPLFGHQDDVKAIQDAFESCLARRSLTGLLLLGEAGSGKQKVLVQFDRYIEEIPEPIAFLFGQAERFHQHVPFGVASAMLRDAAGISTEDEPDDALAKLRKFVMRVYASNARGDMPASVEERAEADVKLMSAIPGLCYKRGRPPEGAGKSATLRVFHAVVNVFRRMSSLAPLFLKLRGADNVDRLTRDLMAYLGSQLRDAPVFFLASARKGRAPLQVNRQIEMRPLSPQSVHNQLLVLLGGPVEDRLTTLVVEKSGGNPLKVAQLVALMMEREWIAPQEGVWTLADERPQKLEDPSAGLTEVLMLALEDVGDDAIDVLEAATICGSVFWEEELTLRLGRSVADDLTELKDARVIAELSSNRLSGQTAYAIRHDTIQQSIYDRQAQSVREAGHRAVAQWMASLAGDSLEDVVRRLNHYRAAGDDESAAQLMTEIEAEVVLWEGESGFPWFAWPDESSSSIFSKLNEAV
jgi:hypothetical protein